MEEETQLEFSGVGAVAGFSLPLGMSAPSFSGSNKKKKKKRKMKSLVSESIELLSELFEIAEE